MEELILKFELIKKTYRQNKTNFGLLKTQSFDFRLIMTQKERISIQIVNDSSGLKTIRSLLTTF